MYTVSGAQPVFGQNLSWSSEMQMRLGQKHYRMFLKLFHSYYLSHTGNLSDFRPEEQLRQTPASNLIRLSPEDIRLVHEALLDSVTRVHDGEFRQEWPSI